MEYLSRQNENKNDSSPINLVIQSPASADANCNAINTSTFRIQNLPFKPSDGYHEYRFDWTPERIVFFADGQLLQEFENTFDGDTPDAPGTLMLNHWSTGNPGWSGGPPAQDAVLTLSYVKAYFNSSDAARKSEWRGACGDQWQGRTCQSSSCIRMGTSIRRCMQQLRGEAVHPNCRHGQYLAGRRCLVYSCLLSELLYQCIILAKA
jgi:hypothetical protein